MARPPSRGGSGGTQQPGWPWLPQHAWWWRSLTKVLETAIRSFAANEASYVDQFEKKALGLGPGP